ncbi:MAG: glucose-1-phosphate thymidylyltransferase [Abditibacteriota bacterium]|nr:glucose-1-phosphate thymidylyltransferase [Abditibacteriota bacterium]
MIKPIDFFDLSSYEHRAVFDDCEYVWEAIPKIGQYILLYSMEHECVQNSEYILPNSFIDNTENIFIGKGTVVEPGAFIQGPAIIGKNCQVRSGAYIRGNVILGDNCIVGHTSELKNVIMLNKAQAPHFNYCGDSILGRGVNLGCGTVLSNLPITSVKDPSTGKRNTIFVEVDGKLIDTKLSKFGAILGDNSQTGCNSVLNPGTILGKGCMVYPNLSLKKGYYQENSIIKLIQETKIMTIKK